MFSYVHKSRVKIFLNPTTLLFVVPTIGTASKVSEVFSGADKLANVVAYMDTHITHSPYPGADFNGLDYQHTSEKT